jgi:hypothetical protein
LGFYACSGFPVGMHAVNPFCYNLFVFFLELKKTKILRKNLGFYACSGFPIGMHAVNPFCYNLFVFFLELKKTKFSERIWVSMLAQDFLLGCTEWIPIKRQQLLSVLFFIGIA